MIQIDRLLFIRIALIFRQIYLSIYRLNENDVEGFKSALGNNLSEYIEIRSELNLILQGHEQIKSKNVFFFRMINKISKKHVTLSFFDLKKISTELDDFLKMFEELTGKDEKIVTLSMKIELTCSSILYPNLRNKEIEKINKISHYGENHILETYSYSQILSMFNM